MTARLYNQRRWRDECAPLVLAEEPHCRLCAEVGIETRATVVDHILSVRDHPDLAFDRDNLQPLCKRHHDSTKQRVEQQVRRRGYHDAVDAHGYPVDPRHPANVTPGGGQKQISAADYRAQHPKTDRTG